MPGTHRAHTPITSGKQRRLFGYWMSNPSEKPASITTAEVESHLHETKGKKLPERAPAIRKHKVRKH